MTIKPLDTLLAIKAISLVPGLTDSDRKVGIVLIEHFSRDTGRCDPGHERLSEMTGLSTRTVIRALKRLTIAGLFLVERHGGYSNRNSYAPNWSRFAQIGSTWQAKFKARSRSRGQRGVSPSRCQPEAETGVTGVTQTYYKNLLNQTCLGRPTEGTASARTEPDPPRLRRPFGIASSDAARTAAERRWDNALRQHFAGDLPTYGDAVDRIDEALRLAATEAELRRRGEGLVVILRRLRDAGSNTGGNTGGTGAAP